MEASTAISVTALLTSAATAWFTVFHKGTIQMTRPNIFALHPREGLSVVCPKIFMRVLLFSTGKRGRALEGMFIKITRGEDTQRFLYWAHGERTALVPGSGVFVGPEGYEANHHFTPLEDNSVYEFTQGVYKIEIVGKILGSLRPTTLQEIKFTLGGEEAAFLKEHQENAVFFWWDSENEVYKPRLDRRPKQARG